MKYLSVFLLMLFVQVSNAAQCRVDGQQWVDVYNGAITVDVNVYPVQGSGYMIFAGYTLECRYTPGGTTPSNNKDYWRFTNGGLTPGAKFGQHMMGLRIAGVNYPRPVNTSLIIATMVDNYAGVDLNTYMYMYAKGAPGKPIDVRVGDILGTLHFWQTHNTSNPDSNVNVYIRAANDFFFEPSTCTINNNVPIVVDFGMVEPLAIGESPGSSLFQKTTRLDYACPDSDIDSAITITLKGNGAGFNSNVLATSNPDLGVGLMRGGVLVRPNGFFMTSIASSAGSDDVTFSLVRKPGSLPAAGPFTSSATLVMGVP